MALKPVNDNASVEEITRREEEHLGGVYEIDPIYKRVVDSYDEMIGSVELDHHELYYNRVKNSKKAPEIVDLTWVTPKDHIYIDLSEKTKQVLMYSDNIDRSVFSDGDYVKDKKSSFIIMLSGDEIKLISKLKKFLKDNNNHVDNINIEGMNNAAVKKVCSDMCNKYDIPITYTNELENLLDSEVIERDVKPKGI